MNGTVLKKCLLPLAFWLLFELIAVVFWQVNGDIFYLINFSYIGTAVALAILLFQCKFKYARRVAQFLIGTYMLVYLGIISQENMQIEGFWYLLFTGVFAGAVIHYLVAKIAGPLIFGRAWCGYACWTAMVLDILPFKVPEKPEKRTGVFRYVLFVVSIVLAVILLILQPENIYQILFIGFIAGNILYYLAGIILAFVFRDNRAFCKYVCPITVFLKPMSYFSLFRVKCRTDVCISCGKCNSVCPMEVNMTDNSRKRKNGTECILCMECVNSCPKNALTTGRIQK